jgi:DNA replication protein DnaC
MTRASLTALSTKPDVDVLVAATQDSTTSLEAKVPQTIQASAATTRIDSAVFQAVEPRIKKIKKKIKKKKKKGREEAKEEANEADFKEIVLEDIVGQKPSENLELQLLMAKQIGVRDENGKFGNYIIDCDGVPKFSEDGKPPKFIGMDNVKLILQELVDSAEYNWLQESQGLSTVPIMLNKLFIGKPGTGKTEIAILWARIIKELHLLSDSSFVSKTASDFISNVVGGSQTKTNAILKASMGKVLFIDEAKTRSR